MVAPPVGILARIHPVERNSSYRGHIEFASFDGFEGIFQYLAETMLPFFTALRKEEPTED